MRIGVSGHQRREDIEWPWVRAQIRTTFASMPRIQDAYSCLAIGSDTVFAEEALKLSVPVTAIIPFPDYQRCFDADDRPIYKKLLARCSPIVLAGECDDQNSFLAAGRAVVEASDLLIAIWDGKPAVGRGGTADVVTYALEKKTQVIHIDPIGRSISRLLTSP